MTERKADQYQRRIRSFVRREGRITKAQQWSIDNLWQQYVIELTGQPLVLEELFQRQASTTIEIGFGHGENLLQLAIDHPEQSFLGIEVYRPGIGALMLECVEHQLSNVRIICGDAVDVLTHQIANSVLDNVLIFFPDPWPKQRHHKRRLIQNDFINLIYSKLKPNGLLHLATDWQDYAEQMLTLLDADPNYINLAGHGCYAERPSTRVESKFERRGKRLGHSVWDLVFMKA